MVGEVLRCRAEGKGSFMLRKLVFLYYYAFVCCFIKYKIMNMSHIVFHAIQVFRQFFNLAKIVRTPRVLIKFEFYLKVIPETIKQTNFSASYISIDYFHKLKKKISHSWKKFSLKIRIRSRYFTKSSCYNESEKKKQIANPVLLIKQPIQK